MKTAGYGGGGEGLLLDLEMGDTIAVMAVPRTVAGKVPTCACTCMCEGPTTKASFCCKGGCPGKDRKGHTCEHLHKPLLSSLPMCLWAWRALLPWAAEKEGT